MRAAGSLAGMMRTLSCVLVLGCTAHVAACGSGDKADGEARVYFVEPRDGATTSSPFMAVFGAENIEVGEVPAEVTTARPGIVHHHLGVNADCLPAGTVVPQASPWIHFGTGANEIEVNLEPGQHRLTVQAGDDEHRTLEGLCETITITVTAE